jgi:type IV secretion system protein VirB1
MKLAIYGCFYLLFALPTLAQEQAARTRLSAAEFVSLAGRCAPGAPADTLLAIARTESGLNANAVSINRPRGSARRAGYSDGEIVLSKQPRNRIVATRWLRWLTAHHFSVSIGLMQVNIDVAPQFSVNPEQLLEPCTNLRVGTAILVSAYTGSARKIGEGFDALDAALSIYNTGDARSGFRNGYVASVYARAPRRPPPF